MLSLGRLFAIALLAAIVYAGFFAVPPGPPGHGHYDADALAADEVTVLQSVPARDEWGTFAAMVPMLREQDRYSWFRAAEAAYYLSRAELTFVGLRERYERVLPDLEDVAAIEKAWMGAAYDPSAVARAELNWWVTRRLPNLNSVDQVAPLIAEEYALRYHAPAGQMMEAATRRAEALDLAGRTDPDWKSVGKLLAESHRALQQALVRPPRGQ
jgi:hypothetical protein